MVLVSALMIIKLPTTMLVNDEFDVSIFLSCPKLPLVNYVGAAQVLHIFQCGFCFVVLFRFRFSSILPKVFEICKAPR